MSQDNTPTPKPTVTITDPERRQEYLEVLGTDTVQVLDATPKRVDFSGAKGVPAFMMDLDALTPEQIDRLVLFLADRHSMAPSLVAVRLERDGVAIWADQVRVNAVEGAIDEG